MATAKYIILDGVAYSPNHPKVRNYLAIPFSEKLLAKPKLRQSSKVLNKLEREFLSRLQADQFTQRVYSQAITFKLCNGVRYLPDFVVVQLAGHQIAYETKGFMRDDAAIKIKMAAKEYPHITWILAWKKDGVWNTQTMLP